MNKCDVISGKEEEEGRNREKKGKIGNSLRLKLPSSSSYG